jgi:hypothetical protein
MFEDFEGLFKLELGNVPLCVSHGTSGGSC